MISREATTANNSCENPDDRREPVVINETRVHARVAPGGRVD